MHATLTFPTQPGGRFFTKSSVRGYRFGFNGKEKVDEVYGDANAYDFGARLYDPRLGRWLAVDPLASKFSYINPYNFAENCPILYIDFDGAEIIIGTSLVENPTQTQKSFTSQLGLYFDNKVKFEIDQYGSLKIMNIPKNLNPEQQANFDRLQAMVKDETKKIYVRIIDHTSDESAIVDDDSWESMVLDVDDASAHSPREGRYNFGTIVMHFFDEQWATQVDKKTTYKSAHDVALSKQIASSDILIVNGVQSAKTDDWNYVMTFDVIDSEQNYVQTMIRTYVDGNITSVAYKNEPEKVGKVDIKNADGQVLNSEHLTKVKPK